MPTGPQHIPAMVAALALLASCEDRQAQQGAQGQEPPAVTVSQPTRRTVTDWDSFTGRFEAVAQVEIRARVNGYVQSVDFQDGAVVKRGDLLYVIDPRPYEAAVAQAAGQLADARSRTSLAERELARGQQLAQTAAIAESVVDQRRQQLQISQASIIQAEANYRRAQLDLEFTRVTAPFDGRIGRHLVSIGNLVQGGEGGSATVLATLVSLDPIHVYFDMDEATYLKNVQLWLEGRRPTSRDSPNPVQITLPGQSAPSHEGRMDFVDNRLDAGTGTLRGRASVPNERLSLVPGQFARVQLIGSAPYEALLLPDAAIGTDQSRKIVYVLKADDTVEARPVQLGPIDAGLRVVRDGLKPDDRVVVDGLQRVRAGQKVKPQAAPPQPGTGATP